MKAYYGFIRLLPVRNHLGHTEVIPPFIELKDQDVRFIFYPDCQQLVVHLPQYGSNYEKLRLHDITRRQILEEIPVSDRLNGEVQLLWDTLYLSPGSYSIAIDWKNGWWHEIPFVKHDERAAIAPEEVSTPTSHIPVVKVAETPRIEYDGNLRAGNTIYIDNDVSISFSHEMGGGNCLVYLFIPSAEQWEQQTRTPLGTRDDILQFVAKTVQREQASGTHFKITDNRISFYFL